MLLWWSWPLHLNKGRSMSTWPQLDILLAVAAAWLLRIEPLPTPKSNLSCYRLNCITREQKIYLPSYAYVLNSRVPLYATTSRGSELHERWPHFCWQVHDLLSLTPLHFRANVTLFPSGCFPTPRPKNELPKIFTQALVTPSVPQRLLGCGSMYVWSDVHSSNQRISRLFLSLFSICYHSSFSISPSFPTFYHSCKSLGKKNKISVERRQTMVSMRFLYQVD